MQECPGPLDCKSAPHHTPSPFTACTPPYLVYFLVQGLVFEHADTAGAVENVGTWDLAVIYPMQSVHYSFTAR